MKTRKNHDGTWITEDFVAGFKVMCGLGQVLRRFDTYEEAKQFQEEMRKEEARSLQ